MRMPRVLAAGLAATLASASLGVTALAPAAPASATLPAGMVQLPGYGTSTPARSGARLLGPAPGPAPIEVQLYFRPGDPEGLQAMANAVSTPGGPLYHHFLTVAQFAARFGAGLAGVGAVDRYLRNEGLTVGSLAPNGLEQPVQGPARSFEAAFGVPLERARLEGGGLGIGSGAVPRLPAELAAGVLFVDGLRPWARETSDLVRFPSASTARPATRSADATTSTCDDMSGAGLTPAQLQAVYQFGGFYSRGDDAQGETIAFVEYAAPDTKGIAQFQECTGSSLSVDYVRTSTPPASADPEVAADVEVIAALAPKATVVVYESNQSGTGLGPWQLAVSGSAPGGLPDVISSSWGMCEAQTGFGSSYYETEQALFEEAATQGQTVLVATGDDGSEGCYDQSGSKALAVDDPASVPWATAVGGTASDTPTGHQYVWDSRGASSKNCLGTGCAGNGAGGGGASSIWPQPSYQPADLPQSPACIFGAKGCRELPDVSALAGDAYAQYCSICGGGPWVGFGGTSLAAPSWGAAVLLSESLCTTKVGFLNPLLYAEPASLTGPVTAGDNDLLGANSGLYGASPTGGYSMAAGLGYLGGADLSGGALCGPGNVAAPTPPTTAPSPGAPTTTTTVASQSTTSTTPSTTTSTTTTQASKLNAQTAPKACSAPVDQALKGEPVALAAAENSGCAGYWVVSRLGSVASFGAALNFGSLGGGLGGATVVAITATPDYFGYWLVASSGRVYPYGDAHFYGDPAKAHLTAPIVGMASTPDGGGYWLAASDGGVFAYGDAAFYGSMGGKRLDKPIIGIAAVPGGKGYWLVSADGGVFAFGNATFRGSALAVGSASPVVGVNAGGGGYRLVTANGGVFSFGATFYGSLAGHQRLAPVMAIVPSADGKGYYLFDGHGDVYGYGDAAYLGDATITTST